MIRQGGIAKGETVAIVPQCVLAGVSRATVYAQQKARPVDESDLLLCQLIDEEFTRPPFYGSRKMVAFLKGQGQTVNRKRVQRLMRQIGRVGMAPGPNTRRPHPEHKVYPYLLRGVQVVRPGPVWRVDITYIRLPRGFAYRVAIIDGGSRKVLIWRISNRMEAVFCIDCREDALRHHGTPEVFNSDQGSPFTRTAFTDVLKREGGVISREGRGRAFDNLFVERLWRSVKHEDVTLKGYASMGELWVGLTEYFAFYNGERPHPSLGNQTPDVVYRTAIGGGAMIVDKFPRAVEGTPVPLRSTGDSSTAKARTETKAGSKAKPGQRRPSVSEAECTA